LADFAVNDGSMAYDHSENIGNEGDLVKHAVLTRVVNYLASERSDSPFIYVETHTGRPEYILPENGKWKSGAGEFSKKSERAIRPSVRFYKEVCIENILSPGSIYPGSTVIVLRILEKNYRPFQFKLYEIDDSAYENLIRYFRCRPQVSVLHADGLAGINDLSKASLVLIDPPNLDQDQEILEALNDLKDGIIECVCWTPRTAGRFKDGRREADTSASFYSKTSSHKRIRVRWGEWNLQGTRGCQITVSEGLYKLAEETILEICRIMSWSPGIEYD
jgi:23S rRNA A2030 N6-methylase RlmJ